mmetsp:Transcript_29377/g.69054  ORF Transcript_29377/g.69054 Transcript_29377/m.69054 type:complete len:200 (+) Transcript_29377:1002-1601(+)
MRRLAAVVVARLIVMTRRRLCCRFLGLCLLIHNHNGNIANPGGHPGGRLPGWFLFRLARRFDPGFRRRRWRGVELELQPLEGFLCVFPQGRSSRNTLETKQNAFNALEIKSIDAFHQLLFDRIHFRLFGTLCLVVRVVVVVFQSMVRRIHLGRRVPVHHRIAFSIRGSRCRVLPPRRWFRLCLATTFFIAFPVSITLVP